MGEGNGTYEERLNCQSLNSLLIVGFLMVLQKTGAQAKSANSDSESPEQG